MTLVGLPQIGEARAVGPVTGHITRAGWVAKRLDNNRALVAGSPEELRRKIEADVGSGPGPGA